jgi:hypothetical protein
MDGRMDGLWLVGWIWRQADLDLIETYLVYSPHTTSTHHFHTSTHTHLHAGARTSFSIPSCRILHVPGLAYLPNVPDLTSSSFGEGAGN